MKPVNRYVKWGLVSAAVLAVVVLPTHLPRSRDQDLGLRLVGWAARGNHERVRELLDRGAEVNGDVRVRLHSLTPLAAAVVGGSSQTVRLLLERGADVNLANSDGWTPLLNACWHNRTEIAWVLLEAGADPNSADVVGVTPLGIAMELGRPSLEAMLLAAGARPESVSVARLRKGIPPLP